MKKSFFLTFLLTVLIATVFSQTDTISTNIYQTDKKLGVGTSDPYAPLSVINDSNYISPNENTVIADFRRVYDNSAARFNIFGYPDTDNVSAHMRKSIMLYATGDAKDFIICASQPEGKIRFFTQTWANPSSERMRIDSIGNVGIGTTKPLAKLQIADGDIYLSDIDKGIIMKSPDGNCWRGTLNLEGQLIFTQVLCPEYVVTYNPVLPISEKIEIFPNPAQNSVEINILDSELKNARYSLFNIGGQELDYGRINNSNHVLDISKLDSGIYLIKVSDRKNNLIGSYKIIKN
jgi:hypothetical protein